MIQLRIFLAIDQVMVRSELRALIEAEPDLQVVGEAGDGIEVLEQIAACQPDVVVIDLVMPQLGGLRTISQILVHAPQIRVLALSIHEDALALRQAFEAGVAGYVLKRSVAETLIDALHTILTGGSYLDPALGGQLMHNLASPTPQPVEPAPALSEREAVVLRLIAQGYSNKEIAYQLDLSVKTVETYKARATEKLGLGSRVEIVRFALERGWLNKV